MYVCVYVCMYDMNIYKPISIYPSIYISNLDGYLSNVLRDGLKGALCA